MITQEEREEALKVVVGPIGRAYAEMSTQYPAGGDVEVSALYEAAYDPPERLTTARNHGTRSWHNQEDTK
jgi:hypothetical protein